MFYSLLINKLFNVTDQFFRQLERLPVKNHQNNIDLAVLQMLTETRQSDIKRFVPREAVDAG